MFLNKTKKQDCIKLMRNLYKKTSYKILQIENIFYLKFEEDSYSWNKCLARTIKSNSTPSYRHIISIIKWLLLNFPLDSSNYNNCYANEHFDYLLDIHILYFLLYLFLGVVLFCFCFEWVIHKINCFNEIQPFVYN